MAKKKKARDEDAPKPPPKAPDKLNRPFAEALKALAEEAKKPAPKESPAPKPSASAPAKGAAPKPAPAPSITKAPSAPARPSDPMSHYGYEDRAAFHQAFAGVRSIEAGKKKAGGKVKATVTADEQKLRELHAQKLDAAEESARERLASLVGGGVRFGMTRESDGAVYGVREGTKDTILEKITGAGVVPESTLDLHGFLGADAEREVVRFVKARKAKGERIVLVVHGKGLHSEGRIGVLEDHVLNALTKGGAAPYVVAFATAPMRLGGLGALVVRLVDR